MSSPPKHDAWPPYKPHQQRVVFVRRQGRLQPAIGYVVTFPISGTGGRALVAYWNEDQPTPGMVMRWLKRNQPDPVDIDPNWINRRPDRT